MTMRNGYDCKDLTGFLVCYKNRDKIYSGGYIWASTDSDKKKWAVSEAWNPAHLPRQCEQAVEALNKLFDDVESYAIHTRFDSEKSERKWRAKIETDLSFQTYMTVGETMLEALIEVCALAALGSSEYENIIGWNSEYGLGDVLETACVKYDPLKKGQPLRYRIDDEEEEK